MKAVVFTKDSLARLNHFGISDEWFSEFGLPSGAPIMKRVVIDEIVFLIEKHIEDENVPLVVVNCSGAERVFDDGLPNDATLDRIITVAGSNYSSSMSIPTTWCPFREGSILSVYAANKEKGRGARIHFERGPEGSNDLFVLSRTSEAVDFENLAKNQSLYRKARKSFVDAVLTEPDAAPEATTAGILLSQRLPQGFVTGASLEKWYEAKLTKEQRQFVDKPYDGPVRLRGSAGTGKTVSLVIKFLRDGQRFESTETPKKMCFLTHSAASVDLVHALAEYLDTTDLIFGPGGKFCKLEIKTLYELAHEHLHFEMRDIEPLSLDGQEGRQLQFELIGEALKEMLTSSILKARFSDLTNDLKGRWRAATEGGDNRFIGEIMSEFASVLDAENIRAGEESGESYAKGAAHRASWLLDLPAMADRRFILEIHRIYRQTLAQMRTLSVDQMVADFNSYLNSNIWDQDREKLGYDAIFVDELHLFTSIERQTLHKCIKRNPDEEGVPKRPPIFMAYDIKQSPRDTFTNYFDPKGSIFTSSSNLQNSELVQLNKVFRYTPQIAEFLQDLDAAFPAIDIPGEWDAYVGEAQLEAGQVPELRRYRDDLMLLRGVFKDAASLARASQDGGRRIAVLCVSEKMFDTYQAPMKGQYKGQAFTITSREDSAELRHAGKRFIFSMPEYVAGLQFETVFLIHVDVSEAPANVGIGRRRQFISNVYLGASRAEQALKICSSEAHGGPSDILDMALRRENLIETGG